jgi:NitT/TauT family transport system permease protein
MKRAARLIVFYAGLFGLWTLLAELKIWPPYLFPTPWGVGEALYAGFQDHSYLIAIAVSMRRVLIGYAISVVLGMILGLGLASSKFLEETMGGIAGEPPELAQHLLVAARPALVRPQPECHSFRSRHGIAAVGHAGHGRRTQADAENLRHGRTQPRRQRISTVLACALARQSALHRFRPEAGLGFAWRSLITAEMLYLSLGLGQVLMMGRDLNDMSAVIAVMILIIAIGYVVDGVVFKSMESRFAAQVGIDPST